MLWRVFSVAETCNNVETAPAHSDSHSTTQVLGDSHSQARSDDLRPRLVPTTATPENLANRP